MVNTCGIGGDGGMGHTKRCQQRFRCNKHVIIACSRWENAKMRGSWVREVEYIYNIRRGYPVPLPFSFVGAVLRSDYDMTIWSLVKKRDLRLGSRLKLAAMRMRYGIWDLRFDEGAQRIAPFHLTRNNNKQLYRYANRFCISDQ